MNEETNNDLIYPVEDELHRRQLLGMHAERERCAEVAERTARQFVNGEATTVYGQGYQAACRHIAKAIRGA